MKKYAQYTCRAVGGDLVDYFHTPNRPRLRQQVALQDRRRRDWPVVEFEIVCIEDQELTVEKVEENGAVVTHSPGRTHSFQPARRKQRRENEP